MDFRLDHVVIAVADLERAIGDYRTLGFTVVAGGRHPGRTSHNALVVFDDGAYLELIAWLEPGPAERWYNEHAKHGEGFIDFALVPDDVPRAVAEAKSRGLALNGPIGGSRVRPDGRKLEWRTGRQTTFDLPFLCGDVTPRDLRVPQGEARRHANGSRSVARVCVAVHDLETSLSRYAALLGAGPDREEAGDIRFEAPRELPGQGLRQGVVSVGTTALVLMAPVAADTDADAPAPARELRDRLGGRGEGPFAIALRGAPGSVARSLDQELTHGARIEMGRQETAPQGGGRTTPP